MRAWHTRAGGFVVAVALFWRAWGSGRVIGTCVGFKARECAFYPAFRRGKAASIIAPRRPNKNGGSFKDLIGSDWHFCTI